VTELVKRAEEAGLLARVRSSRDARVSLLRLTSEGERRLFQVFDALRDDRADFAEAFHLLRRRLDAVTAG
jgi:DNA-binding MarR family transcriptional regulator